jgi:magnesium transporter
MQKRRKSFRFERRTKPGAAPGTLVPLEGAHATSIDVISYGAKHLVEQRNVDPGRLSEMRGKHPVLWINVVGLGDVDLIEAVGKEFGIHSLALEDVMNVHQRAKFEDFEGHLFLIARMVRDDKRIDTEQVAIFMGDGFLLTFQERPGDSLDPVRNRLRESRGRIRSAAVDYLCYALIDAIIDDYFPVLERLGDAIDTLEERVIGGTDAGVMAELHEFKRDLLALRHPIWQHRELANAITRDGQEFFSESTRIYVRDIYDHVIQQMDLVETYREISSGLIDVQISSVSAKLNEIMKVLAIISTIFLPLTFIVGLYGMNFDPNVSPWNMPELRWYLGYPFSLLLMVLAAVGMIWYFVRRGWISLFRRN